MLATCMLGPAGPRSGIAPVLGHAAETVEGDGTEYPTQVTTDPNGTGIGPFGEQKGKGWETFS